MNRKKELLRRQLEPLAVRSESAGKDDLPGLSSSMVDIYDRLGQPSKEKQRETNLESIDKKALYVIRAGIREVKDNMETLLTESGLGRDIQDRDLREMYYGLNNMAVHLTEKIKMPETSVVPEQTIDEDSDI